MARKEEEIKAKRAELEVRWLPAVYNCCVDFSVLTWIFFSFRYSARQRVQGNASLMWSVRRAFFSLSLYIYISIYLVLRLLSLLNMPFLTLRNSTQASERERKLAREVTEAAQRASALEARLKAVCNLSLSLSCLFAFFHCMSLILFQAMAEQQAASSRIADRYGIAITKSAEREIYIYCECLFVVSLIEKNMQRSGGNNRVFIISY